VRYRDYCMCNQWCPRVVTHTCHFSFSVGRNSRIMNSRLVWAKLVRLHLKKELARGGVAQVVECLPWDNPSSDKKKKKKKTKSTNWVNLSEHVYIYC
jgi:hypothetical protein